MVKQKLNEIKTDVLIIGGGGAGLRASIAAGENGANAALVTKGLAARSGATAMAGSGFQAVLASKDNADMPETAFNDALLLGRYLGDENLVYALAHDAADRAADLQRYGVKFQSSESGRHFLQLQPGQSHPRNLVLMGNGYAMAMKLRREVLRQEHIQLLEDMVVTRLFKNGEHIAGALALDMRRGELVVIHAPAVILATGGYQELWRWTDAEPGLTGDGVLLAHQSGADLVDLEMALFYPTALCYPPDAVGTTVAYESLLARKYCGGVLLNGNGEPFLEPSDIPPARDELTKLIFQEIDGGRAAPHGGVYISFDESPLPEQELWNMLVAEKDAVPYNQLRDFNIDIMTAHLEVKPFIHTTLGDVRINEWSETTVPGLFAAGEAAGGLHGANRISGNALTETQIFGERAGRRAALYSRDAQHFAITQNEINYEIERLESFFIGRQNSLRPIDLKRKVKQIMNDNVNHRRDETGLTNAIEAFHRMQQEDVPRLQVISEPRLFNSEWQEAIEAANMTELGELVAAAALKREESRGHHWRTDFPETRPEWQRHTLLRNTGGGNYTVDDDPVLKLQDDY